MGIIPANFRSVYNIDDFTINEYVDLIRIAKSNYRFVDYNLTELKGNFILMRHDCDFSLNRALRIAQIENDNSVISTFFINPHCEFYNVLEKSQTKILKKILELGHNIGLHFDLFYYDVSSEDQLNDLVGKEAQWLQSLLECKIKAFSYHNPSNLCLTWDQIEYGGLINCYSNFFQNNVPYCSDSNGYWRFRRLRDVLEQATDPCLQILTHPGWWQEKPMLPRERILRAVKGRASALMKMYDNFLEEAGRKNIK